LVAIMAAFPHCVKLERILLSHQAPQYARRLLKDALTGTHKAVCNSITFRGFCITAHLEKRQSPRTVGIPAWRKAAIDRKQFVARLRKPKSEETIKAEIRLREKDQEFTFFTTSRIRNIPKEKEVATRIQPEVFLSKDRNTIICYHPAPNYPKEKTKIAWERPSWYGDRFVVKEYSDSLTEEQVEEAKKLREVNSKLWTASVLGHMFKVKAEVVNEQLPLTQDQQFEKDVEKKLLYEWGKIRRLEYKKYQNREILEYIRETRGEAAVSEFRQKMDI